ncbi:PepSY domain-containing protein [Paracoccus sp. (in: a-proteobacteria)]|uniref:PepSY domain-containing protein n=1 Tax=Paracoccus sp. TaxID=267 RepID=UPI00396CEECD
MMFRPLVALAVILTPTALIAQDMPPADSMPLSEILARIETDLGEELAHFEEVDWDDDGYYNVEYRTANGSDAEMRVDPVTGKAVNQ